MPTGTALTVWGRSADSRWLVVTSVSGDAGWVMTADVVAFNIESLPVMDGDAGAAMPAASTPEPMLEPEGMAPAMESPTAVPTCDGAAYRGRGGAGTGDGHHGDRPVTDARLNIRSGPGTGYRLVAKAQPGEVLPVAGRDRSAMWIEVLVPDADSGYGWVSAEYVALSHPILGDPRFARMRLRQNPQADQIIVAVTGGGADPRHRAATGLTGKLVFQANNGGTIYVYDMVGRDDLPP